MTVAAHRIRTVAVAACVVLAIIRGPIVRAGDSEPLRLETRISLGNIVGRIDHMAVDLVRQRLFVAELENDSIGVVDLRRRTLIRTIYGMRRPQGVGYVPSTDTLFVANGRDGSVRLLYGDDHAEVGRIDLGDDADNVRVDIAADRVYVGYGAGSIAIIDSTSRNKIGDVRLKGHPEGFQLDRGNNKIFDRIFANIPTAQAIAVVDRAAGKQMASWRMTGASGNYPMAIDEDAQHVVVALREPAKLVVFSMRNGAAIVSADTCHDADDLFVDGKRRRVYVSCGDGFLDVFDAQADNYRRLARIATQAGARTSLFVPEMDRLIIAARATPQEPAAIWVFRPEP